MMVFLRRWSWLFFLLAFTFSAFYASSIDSGASHDRLKYLSIVWDMYQNHQYLVPMVNGVPYTDKPPLLFWLVTASWHLFGVNMFAIQVVINGLIIAWCFVLRAIYKTIFPEDLLGLDLVPYVLIGSYAVWRDLWFFRPDLLLVLGVLLCNLGIFKLLATLNTARSHRDFWPVFLIIIGSIIGLFGKGPIFYVFTLLPFCISAIYTKTYRVFLIKIISGIMIGTCLFLAVWVIPVIVQMDTDFSKNILYKQIIDRAIAPKVSNSNKAFFIYLYNYIPLLFMPWIINLIFFKKLKNVFCQKSPYRSFIFTLFMATLIIFTAFGQKSLWYVLPSIPFGLLFFTRYFVENQYDRKIIKLNKFFLMGLFGLLSILCIVFYFSPNLSVLLFKNSNGNIVISPQVILGFSAASFMIAIYIFFKKENLLPIIFISSLMLILFYSSSKVYVASQEKNFTNIEQAAVILRQQMQNKKGVMLYQVPSFIYLGQFNYSARLTENLVTLTTPKSLIHWLQQYPEGIVIVYGKKCPVINNLNKPLREIGFYIENAKLDSFLFCRQ